MSHLLGEGSLLVAWNGVDTGIQEAPVHEIALQQALARPEALAVSWDGGSLTYGELLDRSLRLAAWLRRRGIGDEDLVALRMERSAELVVSSLGILLSGAAYLPIDPSNPSERLTYVLRDSGASMLLTTERLRLPGLPLEQVALESLDLDGDPGDTPLPEPDRLAYVIYTSGSTGAPKGTDLVHRGLSNTIAHYLRKYLTEPGERMALLASPGFDASVWEIWLALTTGSSLHVAPAEILASAPDLLAWYTREGISHSFAVPVQVEAMLTESLPPGLALRRLLAGGDRLRLRPRQDCPFVVVNNYGPTEVSIVTTEGVVAAAGDQPPTIGRPLDNVRVHLLDTAFESVPAGAPGELFIGGEGVARGYRGRPDLTAERFVPDPFGPPGARLYRSGDLARLLPSGEIDFIGRADHQVKLRGFRIELGEIESVLLGHPGVRGAAVLLRPAEGRLAGYVALAANGAAPSVPELREHLASRLPDYMVPTVWAVLDSLPLNASGKVDRRALERVQTAAVADEGYSGDIAPRTQLEELLAGLFAEVLDIEGVGIHQDFFQLGGHSLVATRLTSRVRELCGVELGLRSVFEHPTVASLASWIEHQQGRGEIVAEAAILLTPALAGPVPLSSAQQRLWFLERLRPGTALYNLAQLFDFRGELTVPALAVAFDAVVRRHEALRTLFAARPDGGDPVQLVCREPLQREPLPVVDLEGLPEPTRRVEAERITSEEARRPYDLERGPLMRTALLRLGPEEHRLLIGTHHIVSDAWSVGVLLRELSALYRAALAVHASPLPPLPVQYPGFAVWQHRRLTEEAAEVPLSWWREHLAGVPPVLELQADRLRPAVPSLQGERLRLPLGTDLEPAFAALGRRQGTTLFMTLLAAFQALLHRYTLQEDFVVGSPVAGRNRLELEALIGFFVNMLPLRASASEAKPFSRLLAGVRESVLAGFAHQDLPFDRLVEELAPQRDLSRTPLFQVAFALQEAMAGPDLGVEVTAAAEIDTGVSKFDLTLLIERGPHGLDAIAEYSSGLFDRETVQHMLGVFRVLVAGALADPAAPIGELPLLAAAEREQVVSGWNQTAANIPETPVHRQFERQAAAHPGALAVASAEENLTYGELNRRANLLAWRLRRLGIGAEDIVALLLERSPELPLAALATLKAGGAYLPIDPAYPAERVLHVLRDSGAQALLTTSRIMAGLPEVPLHAGRMILLDGEPVPDESSEESKSPPPAGVDPDGLAYVIYTSGSTGMPKGTELHHRGLCNLVAWHARTYGLNDTDKASLIAGPGFDASVFEMWPPLVAGSSAHVPPPEALLSPSTLLFWLAERGVTVAFLPTPLAEGVLPEPMPADLALRLLTTGGDRLLQRPAADLRFPLVNMYGPTEATVVTTTAVVAADGHRTPHIGGPIANLRVHLLDRGFVPLPVGVPGELCVAGVGLARGYRGRPDLTAERFVPDPLGGLGDRLYRTGDLARRLPGGEIEFLGRIDQQVKIRGYRIELGEIEAALRRHPNVREAVALVREADRRLVGCVVLHEAGELREDGAAEALRASLANSLPEVMIPTAWVYLEALPLTPNGKVDRRALARIAPAPEAHATATPPRTPTEAAVAEVWSGLLRVEGIGAYDDFFALGGHSLLAARLGMLVQKRLGVELPLLVIFQEPTVARLAAWIEAAHLRAAATAPNLVAGLAGQLTPLSFAQQRLWFLDQLKTGSATYNIPIPIFFSGPLRSELVDAALTEVMRRHTALRTTFEVPEGAAEPVQVVHPAGDSRLHVVDLGTLPGELRGTEAMRLTVEDSRRPFDLRRLSLLRTTLLHLSESEHRLLVTMHHIVSDGWSTELLQRELGVLYEAFSAGRPSPLPELPVQYGDFAVWQRSWLSGQELDRQLAYWRVRLAEPPALELPTDRPRPAVWSQRGAVETASLPAGLADGLARVCRRSGVTPFMTLLAAFFTLLQRYTAQEDLVVGTPLAGRSRPEVQGLIGFFVNTLALRVSLDGELSFETLLARVRETALEAYDHQDVPFEKLVAELVPDRDLSRNPLFQVVFSVQEKEEPARMGSDLVMTEGEWVHHGTAKFDLSLLCVRSEHELRLWAEYGTDLFDAATVQRLMGHFRCVLEGIAVGGEGVLLYELPLMEDAERQEVLTAWNRTQQEVPDEPVHRQVFLRAERTPDALALSWEGGSLTYAELTRRAADLANCLRAQEVGPETLVALRLERSAELVIAALAVLETGGAYLPIDPAHPVERTEWIVQDSGAVLLLTRDELVSLPPVSPQAVPPRQDLGADSLAYVIYTSGSTGTPKGVELRHRGLTSLVAWICRNYGLGPDDRTTLVVGPGFDAAMWEIWGTLTAGASLHIPSREVLLSPVALLAWMVEKGITMSLLPSPLAEAVLAEQIPEGLALRNMITGGDRLRLRPAPDLPFALFNHYGPTECTVASTAGRVASTGERPPEIGAPLANTRIYMLDRWLQPVPVGVPGELCLAGEGLARGYRHQPDLTAGSFVPDPFADGERMYRSGDLARWLPSGEIEFLGRIDHQVKIRGFRIELGEIEATLGRHPAVHGAVVLVHDERLVAYVVAREVVTADVLRAWLAKSLPDVMVPAAWVFLDAIPLTLNGKVDRRALPEPEALDDETFVPPSTATQRVLARIWGSLLSLERVGARDNFFQLGGHSLSATQLATRVHERFGITLELRAIFENPVLEALAAHVDSVRGSSQGDTEREGMYPLSFAQQRLWFLDRLRPGLVAYNIPALLRFVGPLHPEILATVLNQVVSRHAALRTTFETSVVAGDPVQVVHRSAVRSLSLIDLAGLPPDEREAEAGRLTKEEAKRPFDLWSGPMLRTALLRLEGNTEHRLLATMHQIVADSWSLDLLLRELGILYGACAEGRLSSLPDLPMQFPDFAAWQRTWLTGDEMERQLGYWHKFLARPPVFELPMDRPRPAVWSFRGDVVRMELSETLAGRLERFGQSHQATPFTTLFAGFLVLLYRHTGQEDLLVGTPVAGRSRVDTEELIGPFANMLPLRVGLEGEPTFLGVLDRARESALAAYACQDIPFEKLAAQVAPERDQSRHPLFQVLFAFLEGGERNPIAAGLTMTLEDPVHSGTSKFDLSFHVTRTAGRLHIWAEYATALFDRATVLRLSEHFARLLEEALAHPELPVARLPLLGEAERAQLAAWDEAGRRHFEELLHARFEAQAVHGTRGYVLDRWLQRLPAGIPGELCLAGAVLTSGGYLVRPELMAERFLPDPFSAEPGARMYRTGDRVRLRQDGLLEHLGRLQDDRRTLPAPAARPPATVEFVAPRTALEDEVAQVWIEVLGVERVGSNDSFWDLGGHSLLATRALARLESSFGVSLQLQSLFASPTLGGFSSVLAESVLASEGESEMNDALAALGDMSEEEVRALIEQTVRELEELV